MHSIAFHLGPLTVHWYGILVALGFLAGLWTAGRRARLAGITQEQVFDLGPWLILGGILGGRILYVISYWKEDFANAPLSEIFMVQHGGLVFYGGLIGATAGAMIYLRLKKLPVWKMADILAPSIALGYVFGRIGCLMNGCCYGRACSLPWAISFPADHATRGEPVHPTEIYDSVLNLLFYCFLAWLFRRKKFDGQVFAVYLIGYAILRSFVEYFRGDYPPVHYLGGWATPAQVVSVGIILGGGLLFFLLPRPVENRDRQSRMVNDLHPQILCLAGATATGKSEVALLLAEQLGGEIISVDSMQVYRGLDIGTAKPGPEERRRAPHHLIDVAELSETFDAARFSRLADQVAREIRARGRVPILCGGTGLYFKAFLEGVGEGPPADLALRAELEATSLSELLGELEQRDPATFALIDRKNPRRVIRAVEVIRLTGKPFSIQRVKWTEAAEASPLTSSEVEREKAPPPQANAFGLVREVKDLHARISARVERMFQRGLVEEVRELLRRGLAENRTAMQAIGYRQVAEHLSGERPLPETIELVKVRTRQFAKRQMTWFRRHAQMRWLEVGSEESPERVAGRIIEALPAGE